MRNNVTYCNKQTKQMKPILSYAQVLSDRLCRVGRYSTARAYVTAAKRFALFMGTDDVPFSSVTPECLKRFEQDLLGCNCQRNTVSMYMRMLRSVYNQAVMEGMAEPFMGLFEQVFTGNDVTRKRAISPAMIRRIKSADLSRCPHLEFCRDLFLLSFYLRGIPFVDLLHLRKTDIHGDELHYRRSKTGRTLSVRLEPCARELIRKYSSRLKPNTSYLFPFITKGGASGYRQYQSALRKYNFQLSQLSTLLGLEVRLSSYVARHSWATAAYHNGVAVSVISECLGHSSEKVTHIYLASMGDRILSRANRSVIRLVNSCSEQYIKKKRKTGIMDIGIP